MCVYIMKSAFYRNGWTDRAGICHGGFFQWYVYTVLWESWGYCQNNGTSLWNFITKSEVGKFHYGMSIVAACTKADAQCDKLTIVVSWIIVFATVAVRPTTLLSISRRASTAVHSTMCVRQRVARVRLRQLTLVTITVISDKEIAKQITNSLSKCN